MKTSKTTLPIVKYEAAQFELPLTGLTPQPMHKLDETALAQRVRSIREKREKKGE